MSTEINTPVPSLDEAWTRVSARLHVAVCKLDVARDYFKATNSEFDEDAGAIAIVDGVCTELSWIYCALSGLQEGNAKRALAELGEEAATAAARGDDVDNTGARS